MVDEISERLEGYLAGRLPGAQVTDVRFLVSGFESDLFTFTLRPPASESRSLILRLYPGDGAAPKILREVDGLLRLHQAGFPVAAIHYYETDPALLGKPFTIMEKLEGSVLWPLLYQIPPSQAGRLLERFGSLIAQLHRLDWRPFSDHAARYESSPAAILDDSFASSRQFYERFGVAGFAAVIDWLEAHQARISVRPAVAHLDLHANNVLLCDDGRMAVIDWTQVTVADYRSDLSWTLMIMGDFGQAGWRERILQAYTVEAGHPVEDLDYFSVISDTKLLASTVISLKTSPAALGLRAESGEPADQQAQTLARLAGRVKAITGITIPEVEEILSGAR